MNKPKNFAAAICLLSLPLLFGCSHLLTEKTKPVAPPAEYAALMAKKDELASLPTTEKPNKKPVIKGKIVVVQNHNGTISLDRFSEDGSTFFADLPVQGEIYANFLHPDLYAKRPEEIETLIKINCVTKKGSALYTRSGSSKVEPMEYDYTVCDVSLVDYKTATVFGKKQLGKDEAPNIINKNTYGRTPGREIADYLQSSVEKPGAAGL